MRLLKSGYFYIFVTITFTVMGQLLIKAGMSKVTASFNQTPRLVALITGGLLHPIVLAGLVCAFVAAIAWFPAVSRLPISVAYPFMALPIMLVLVLAPACFGERVTVNQWLGVLIVSLGLWVGAR